MTNTTRKLVAESIKKTFSEKPIVNGVSLEITQGKIVGLLGPNGAGKTTSFYMIAGLLACDMGNIYCDQENITKLPMERRVQLGIGYLPQEASVFRGLSVEDNLLAVQELYPCSYQERTKKMEQMLEVFQLNEIRKNKGYSLSGGERRRVELARALVLNPSFMLLDEPFAGVDPIAVIQIKKLLEYLKSQNIGIFISDHNVRETLDCCDYCYIMHSGKVMVEGTTDIILHSEIARARYLGNNFSM